ncbi:fungal hydrophobin-domain-containing protein [Usnea florida]
MYFSTIVITALLDAYIAMAGPAYQREIRQETLCSGLEDEPLCCAVSVLGVASLDCTAPNASSIDEFETLCASLGLEDQCCTVDALGEALLCESPSDSGNLES